MAKGCWLLLILLTGTAQAEEVFTIGVFPRRSPPQTLELFTPLADYLSRYLGRTVVVDTAPDFSSFWENVSRQKYDLVHYNQYQYVRSHREFGYQVIARNEEFGQADIPAAIVVRKDSGIERISDLKGKKVVFGGGHTAMISYIVATDLLRRAGLEEGDYLTQFALNPPKACVATFYRQASAAGVGGGILKLPGIINQIDVNEMKLIAVSEPLAHLPWAVNKRTSKEMTERIQAALMSLSESAEGRQILKSAHLTGLVVSTDADYDPHREIIKRVLGEQY